VFCSLSQNPVVADSQYALLKTGILRPEKRTMAILSNVSSVVQPGRMTLLLGPPAAGKSTLLKALAGKLSRERGLKVRLGCHQDASHCGLLSCALDYRSMHCSMQHC